MSEGALANRIAIVTGAASGIGKAIVEAYHGAGARILAADLNLPEFPELAGSDRIVTLVADVTAEDAPDKIVKAAIEAFGGLDILVNNAGICLPGSIEDQSLASWEKTLAINVTAPFRLTQAALPHMKGKGWGRIINLGSIMSDFGGPSLCAYGMSKHAMAGFTKSLAVDLGKYGITANYLQPGSIWTGMSRPFMEDQSFLDYWNTKTPVGRLGEPEEVAAPALFLATDEARFITGAGIRICGGAMASF
ncbi:SDR family NAD(P)-dependent oxidoreductase [Sphingobium phenoxybenzoativorans]|uniref:SDR family NAD(P)-dependent oxidoreductase n=1 Tax=Sphingobium phenoxybenzoativorans TaxID=1592790 RepID=UPI000871F4D4|nr:SDR family oxidoreductase [Sphingobium phenoxybenzoativorans]